MKKTSDKNGFKMDLKYPFSLKKTLMSDQCPADLWFLDDLNHKWVSYIPIKNQWIKVMLSQEGNSLLVTYAPNKSNIENIKKYLNYQLSLDYDITNLKSSFYSDNYISTIFKYCKDLRLMKDHNIEYRILEAIITQNTSVRMIKTMQKLLFLHYGNQFQVDGENIYTYPNIEKIANESVATLMTKCKVGYRAKYIKIITKALSSKKFIEHMEKLNTQDAKNYLMEFKGIGRKVSDLILMYGLKKDDVFPLDVWVKRAVKREYFKNRDVSDEEIYEFSKEYFGNFASIINLMIFTYERIEKNLYFNYCIWK